MAEPALVRSFRFQVKLRKAPGTGGGGAGASVGFSASASASLSVGAGGISASASASASFGVGIGGPGGDQLGDGAFQECTGLEISMDVQDYLEGGRNDGVIKRVGRGKYAELVLKRGMVFRGAGPAEPELWSWLQGVLRGERPVRRYDGIVEVMDPGEQVVARWVFDRGLPAKLTGPSLNARTGDVAIEELHIAHEGLRLVVA